jgi:predicted GNAT family acetyltransferase
MTISRKNTTGLVEMTIKEIMGKDGLRNSARIIRASSKTVASEFAFTKKNCPTHPSFVTIKQLNKLKRKGLIFLGLFMDNRQIGFVAVEKANESLYYVEKLAIPQELRYKGYGRNLIEFCFEHIKVLMAVRRFP